MLSISAIKPRGWQEDALADLLDTKDNVLVQASTGAGKSFFIMMFAHQSQKTMVIITHVLSLMHQWCDEMDKLGINYYNFHGKNNQIPDGTKIVVSTYQTWRDNTQVFSPDCLILDEAHKSTSDSYDIIFSGNKTARRIGLSATPVAPIGAATPLKDIYDRLLITSSTSELMEDGVIMKPRMIDATSLSEKTEKVLLKDKGEYTATTLSKASKLDGNDAFGACKTWQRYIQRLENRRTLIFATDVAHARIIKKDFTKIGVICEVVVSDMEEDDLDKREVADKLSTGEVEVVVSVNMLSEGFNCPMAANAILCRPTKNIALAVQQFGRALRSCKGKDECLVIDVANVFLSTCLPTDNPDWPHLFKYGLGIDPFETMSFEEFIEDGGLEDPLDPQDIPEDIDPEVLLGFCEDHGEYIVEFRTVIKEEEDGKTSKTSRPTPCPTCSLKKQISGKAKVKKKLEKLYMEFKAAWTDYVDIRNRHSFSITQHVFDACTTYYGTAHKSQKAFYMTTIFRLQSLLEIINKNGVDTGGGRAIVADQQQFWDTHKDLEEIHHAQMHVSKKAKDVLKCLRELRHCGVKLNKNIFKTRDTGRLTHIIKPQFQRELLSVRNLLEVWQQRETELNTIENKQRNRTHD